jgi:hypothetical protein
MPLTGDTDQQFINAASVLERVALQASYVNLGSAFINPWFLFFGCDFSATWTIDTFVLDDSSREIHVFSPAEHITVRPLHPPRRVQFWPPPAVVRKPRTRKPKPPGTGGKGKGKGRGRGRGRGSGPRTDRRPRAAPALLDAEDAMELETSGVADEAVVAGGGNDAVCDKAVCPKQRSHSKPNREVSRSAAASNHKPQCFAS